MKNIATNNKLRILFNPILALCVIFYLIPGKYKAAIYGLNYLGWITAVVVFFTFILPAGFRQGWERLRECHRAPARDEQAGSAVHGRRALGDVRGS